MAIIITITNAILIALVTAIIAAFIGYMARKKIAEGKINQAEIVAKEIVEKALLALREKISIKPIGFNLLPEKFTLSELQKLYEAILGKELNRGNFYRKIKNPGILGKLDEQKRGGAHKAPDLYSFDEENYNKALENGLTSW